MKNILQALSEQEGDRLISSLLILEGRLFQVTGPKWQNCGAV